MSHEIFGLKIINYGQKTTSNGQQAFRSIRALLRAISHQLRAPN